MPLPLMQIPVSASGSVKLIGRVPVGDAPVGIALITSTGGAAALCQLTFTTCSISWPLITSTNSGVGHTV